MEDRQSLTRYSEPERIIEDCVDYFNRHKDTESIYRNRANGDDLGHVEDTEEIEGENDE